MSAAPPGPQNIGLSLGSYYGETDLSNAGWSVAALGDVNGDGFGDVLIGSPEYDDLRFGLASGRAYLVFGKASGWDTGVNVSLANVIFTGIHDLTMTGFTVAALGDVNHDGLADFAVSAPLTSEGGYQTGKVYIFFGRASWASSYLMWQADASFIGEGSDRAGLGLASAGDANGDGFDDILIGSPANDQASENSGKAYLILGKATGWASNVSLSTADASFHGVQPYDTYPLGVGPAIAVSKAGDVNGDGLDDILIGTPGHLVGSELDHGAAYLIFGRTFGWTRNVNLSKADVVFTGESQWDRLGWSLASAGDVNGDGFDDFMISAPWNWSSADRAGRTYLFLGKAGGWARQGSLASASATFFGVATGDHSGFALAGGHDINGDGLSDMSVSAHTAGTSGAQQGLVYVLFGKASGWVQGQSLSTADLSYIGESRDDWAGYSLGMGPDVNGDGNDDLVVGAPFHSQGAGLLENGMAYILAPLLNSRPSAPQGLQAYVAGSSNPAVKAELTQSLTVELVAGDTDATRVDSISVRVRSSTRDAHGFLLRLVETGGSTGIFRGSAAVRDMTHPGHGWIGGGPGETVTFSTLDSRLSLSLPVAFTGNRNLSSFPRPFVEGGAINATLVVALSQPHYPAGAANTIDAVGGVTVAMSLGRQASQGELRAVLDSELVSSPDDLRLELAGGGNLITFGGEGNNLVTRAVNSTMPIVQGRGAIRSIPTGTQYRRLGNYGQGTPVTDYAYVALGYDLVNGRYILAVAGLSGFATRRASQAVADGVLPLNGQGVVLALADDNGDMNYERVSVAEVVWSERSLRGSSGYVFRPDIQPLEATATSLPPLLVSGGVLNATIVVAYSLPHTPVGAASTIDVVGSLTFGFKLGRATNSGRFSSVLDLEAARWDAASSTIVITAPGNLVAFGGRGNNLVSRYYNASLPIRQENFLGVYVAGTGHSYLRGTVGSLTHDYAFYARTFDVSRGGWAYVVAGLSGFATRGIGQFLGGRVLPMDANGGVIQLTDTNADGTYDRFNNVETSGGPAALSDYPYPFRFQGILNVSLVIGLSQNHPPGGAANTIDAVGGVVMAMALGRGSSGGRLDALLDTEVAASFDGRTIVPLGGGNIIALGGQGSNLVTRYYNMSTSVGPVRYQSRTFIEVFGTKNLYGRSTSPTGVVTDYSYLAMIYDQALGRHVLVEAGLSGFATKATAQLLADGALRLQGTGMVLRLNDTNGDGQYESWDVVESSGPIYLGHSYPTNSTPPPKVRCRTNSNLADFPCPYVSNGALSVTLVLGYSLPHGSISGASTIDVLGGILIGASLGRASISGPYRAALDIDVMSADGTTLTVTGNVISIGGRGGNLATRAINPSLPVRQALATDGNGRGIYSTASGSNYVRVTYADGSVDDFAFASFVSAGGRYLAAVVGLSGLSTRAMMKLLSLDPAGLLTGTGVVVKLQDLGGNGVFETYQSIDGSGSFTPMPSPQPFPSP